MSKLPEELKIEGLESILKSANNDIKRLSDYSDKLQTKLNKIKILCSKNHHRYEHILRKQIRAVLEEK